MLKKITKLSLVLVLLFSTTVVNAATEDKNAIIYDWPYSSSEYVLSSYDVNIVVNENNTFDITETINAYYNVYKHGIIRKLPLSNNIERLDGTTTKNRAKVTNVNVNDNYSVSKNKQTMDIKIGSADKTIINGPYEYIISYNYNIGKDPLKEIDELYYNIIGTEWDTYVGNVTFTITMPKEFDASKLGFSSGLKGSTENYNVKYQVDGNVITGRYDGILSPNEGLTVRLELEEGYFVGAGIPVSKYTYLIFLIPLAGLILSFVLWNKYGKDDIVVDTVEFYPPQNMNSLEVGYLYKGYADNKDVVSLLIYLANNGYLKIKETEEKTLFGSANSFEIIKIKDYDGTNKYEKEFFKGLFKCKSKLSKLLSLKNQNDISEDNNVSVTKSDLYDNFYKTMNSILSDVNTKANKNQIFESSASSKTKYIVIAIMISIVTILGIPVLDCSGVTMALITVAIVFFYTPFYAVGLSTGIRGAFRIIWLGFTIIHSSIFFGALITISEVYMEPIYIIGILFGFLCIIGMIIFCNILPKRTEYGTEMLGKLRGFKKFLETAEKEQLEQMVTSNPTYFYDILPFTYVLGVSDKWIKKFESIALQAPDWYDSPTGFNATRFGAFMTTTMASAQSSMSSSPSSSSSGGFSGGGSSGGGSGGGGGSSW